MKYFGNYKASLHVTVLFWAFFPLQVVPGSSQENGQTKEEEEEEEEVEKMETEKPRRTSRDNRKSSFSEDAPETQTSVSLDGEAKKGESLWILNCYN